MNIQVLVRSIRAMPMFADGVPAEDPLVYLDRVKSEACGAWIALTHAGEDEAAAVMMRLRGDAFDLKMAIMQGLAS